MIALISLSLDNCIFNSQSNSFTMWMNTVIFKRVKNPFLNLQGITPTHISFWSLLNSPAAWGKQDKMFGAGEWQSLRRAGAWTFFLSLCRAPLSSLHLSFWATSQRHRVPIDYMETNTIQDSTWLISKLSWIRVFCLLWRTVPAAKTWLVVSLAGGAYREHGQILKLPWGWKI